MSASPPPAANARLHAARGIQLRLLAATLLVVVVAVVTTSVVAEAVGPPMFRRLMDAAVRPGAGDPYEKAFRHATAVSVGVALGASAVIALVLSFLMSRRVHRSATALAAAAAAVAEGHYGVHIPGPRLGREFDAVTDAFNAMTARLACADRTRRQLMADLAHEIKNPVAVLEAYMEAFDDGVAVFDDETLRTLRDQTSRLTRFSDDVRILADAEATTSPLDRRWTTIDEWVAPSVAAFAPRYAAKGVELRSFREGGDPSVVFGDYLRLTQVMNNLLDNALRHSDAGEVVDIAVRRNADALTVSVSDTGTGIAPEHLGRIFERFYRTDAARDRHSGGAGIGLAIAQAIVERHHGHLRASSAGLGRGTTFTVELPATSPARPTIEPLEPQQP